ncbi:MAG: VCBS repeat-containing protein, partial [Acidimicrobiales bacterium]|nr:VCBS repeat-containing protein [Acidimicrobiales bacterium]
GDLDAFGTEGVGSEPNADMVWARNDGGGQFTVIPGIAEGDGDFVQGATAGAFGDTERLRVLISWHEAGKGIQSFSPVVGEESTRRWDYEVIIDESQDEDLSSPDVDGDGDLDVMMGTMWLPNRPGGSPTVTLHQPATGTPDRHRSVDMDGDGDIDVVVSYEDSQNGRVAWYEQGDNPEDPWTEHPIGDVTLGLSMDVGDIDRDGDIDVVVGEHSTTDPNSMSLLLFENGGDSRSWLRGRISTGDEHHDATVLVDLDGDNDLDIASLGWTHGRVVVFENPGV